MDSLKENYLASVMHYFHGFKKLKVRHELLKEMRKREDRYESEETMLIGMGHPKSVAYNYGYRPYLTHQFSRELIHRFEKSFFLIMNAFILLSAIYYLQAFSALPQWQIFKVFYESRVFSMILRNPFLVICLVMIVLLGLLFINDMKKKDVQEEDLSWNKKKLYALPASYLYAHHHLESGFMMIFCTFFFLFNLFFTINPLHYSPSSLKNIHLMILYFQPYMAIIFIDFLFDLSKRTYEKSYLHYSLSANILIFLFLNYFLLHTSFLKNYLLPLASRDANLIANGFVIGAIFLIEYIVIYKISKNIKNLYLLSKKRPLKKRAFTKTYNI